MRFIRTLVGFLSLAECMLLVATVIFSLFSPDNLSPDQPIQSVLALAVMAALLFPFAFLGYFSDTNVSASHVGAAAFFFVAFVMATIALSWTKPLQFEVATIMIRDRLGLEHFVKTIVASPWLTIIMYFGKAISIIILGFSLKPVIAVDRKARSLRVYLVLAGFTSLSVVAAPLMLFFLILAYYALGIFLITTRIGVNPKPSIHFVDDYFPS